MFDFVKKGAVNKAVVHGKWGEETAARYLEERGYLILERNVRPCKKDRRLEIDIVAYMDKGGIVVFVEVKQHASRSEYQCRLRSIDNRKRRLMRRASRAWLVQKKWMGSYRYDVIEVYGVPDDKHSPEIDHIERIDIFTNSKKYVNWNE